MYARMPTSHSRLHRHLQHWRHATPDTQQTRRGSTPPTPPPSPPPPCSCRYDGSLGILLGIAATKALVLEALARAGRLAALQLDTR